jgi:hypothetical protein
MARSQRLSSTFWVVTPSLAEWASTVVPSPFEIATCPIPFGGGLRIRTAPGVAFACPMLILRSTTAASRAHAPE